MSVDVLLFFLFDNWEGKQCMDLFFKEIIICRTTGAFQGMIFFLKEKLKVKVEILLQYACDIKSWLGPFTKPLVSSALQNSTL